MIKHISFDFWDTLFKGNPEFKRKRIDFLSEFLGIADKNLIDLTIHEIKEKFDKIGEETLTCIHPKTQIWFLLNKLTPNVKMVRVNEVYNEWEALFWKNPPIPLFDMKLFDEIDNLGLTTSISCNTGLIPGDAIRSILHKYYDPNLFQFTLFSDSIGHFKPSPFFMEDAFHGKICFASNCSEILHVGDNLNTDGKLCENTGMKFFHIKKGQTDLNQIFDHLN